MNKEQVGGIVRSVLLGLSGWAISWGFTQEEWLSFAGGVVALASMAWSLYSNSTTNIIKQAEVLTK